MSIYTLILLVVLIDCIFLASALKVIPDNQQALLLRLGRPVRNLSPGIRFIIPFTDKILKFPLEPKNIALSGLSLISRDNHVVKLNGSISFKIENPMAVFQHYPDPHLAVLTFAQNYFRKACGELEAMRLPNARAELERTAKQEAEKVFSERGIRIESVVVQTT